MVRFIGVLFLLLAGIACGRKSCEVRYNQSVKLVESHLDPDFMITLCKGGRNPRKVQMTMGFMQSTLNFPAEIRKFRVSRPEDVCSDASNSGELVPVALASESFKDAKLCYKDATKTAIILLAPAESCPAGTTQQALPVDDCSSL